MIIHLSNHLKNKSLLHFFCAYYTNTVNLSIQLLKLYTLILLYLKYSNKKYILYENLLFIYPYTHELKPPKQPLYISYLHFMCPYTHESALLRSSVLLRMTVRSLSRLKSKCLLPFLLRLLNHLSSSRYSIFISVSPCGGAV